MTQPSEAANLKHPCAQTCSGYDAGRRAGMEEAATLALAHVWAADMPVRYGDGWVDATESLSKLLRALADRGAT